METFLECPEFVLKDMNQKGGIMYQKRFIDEKREHVKRVIIAMAEKTKVKPGPEKELDIAAIGVQYGDFRKSLSGRMVRVPKTATCTTQSELNNL